MYKKYIAGLIALIPLFFSCSSKKAALSETAKNNAGWVVGDFHEHSHFSDGGMKLDSVFEFSTRNYGVNFMLNTDHGGAYPRDWDGKNWSDMPEVKIEGSDPGVDADGKRLMWRWQELRDYSYPRVAAFRKKYPDRHYIQGLEWNSPATSHTTVGVIADNGLPIASFEYQFDSSDKDIAGGPAKGLSKMNGRIDGNGEMMDKEGRTAATRSAIKWLAKNHPHNSWALIAHPERGGNVKIEDLRNINNAGPDVAFGFEGIPGHQKNTLRGIFFPKSAMGGGLYGGVGYMAGKVGGIWDALLGEGRHFWLFTSSDFHGTQSDFWPGEYHKTWIYSRDTTSATSVLEGMRAGNVFVSNGDLVNKLDFKAIAANGNFATMGETLIAEHGKTITIKIRFHSAQKNNNGNAPAVQVLQIITGDITGRVEPGQADFNKDTNESSKIVKLFTPADWKTKAGWSEVFYKIENPKKDQYIRIRGTNHPVGTAFETDQSGNPLPDSLANNLKIDGPQEAWADLWFYSNPIFINLK